MLGPLTYHAIAAMTRERLRHIDELLVAKIRSHQNPSDLERQVRFLAKRAHEIMSQTPHLPNDNTLPPFARQISQQAIFGSIGPSFPRYAAQFALSQSWLFDTIHRGNADPNREMVMARSSDFLLELWERARSLIEAANPADKLTQLEKMRGYVLGHTCHIAADLVSAPFVFGLKSRLGVGGVGPFSESQITEAIEERVANRIFGKSHARGDDFKDWWPTTIDLPIKFFDAYKEALEAKFGPGARPKLRPAPGVRTPNPQVSRSFNEKFRSDAPPDLSVRLLEDGFSAFRASLEHRYVWNWGDWVAATWLMWLPPIFAYPLIVALPQTRALFKDGETVNDQPVKKGVGWLGLLMAPLVTSSLSPIALSIYISAFTNFGVGRETVLGWIVGGLNLITSIIFLITKDEEENPGLRGVFLFGLPFVGLAFHAIYVLTGGGGDRRRTQLALSSLVPVIVTAAYLIFHLSWHTDQGLGMNGWLKKKPDGSREEWGNAGFLGGWFLWAGLMIAGWLLLPLVLRDRDDSADVSFVTGRGHFLRMFDQSSLFFDPELAQNPNAERRNPSLATHFYPTDRRPLAKIWWEGEGEMHVRSERFALRFSTANAGTNADQFVLAPPAPMTLAGFARFLNRAVTEGAIFTRNLKVELVDEEDFDYILPPGELFSDRGDDKTTIELHDPEAAKFTKLTTKKDDKDVVLLFHAPRARLANFVGKNATVVVDEDRRVDTPGDGGQITVVSGNANVVGSAAAGVNTKFATFFKRGDLIATAGGQVRIVSTIQDDQNLTVTMPFGAGEANVGYARKANNRDDDLPGAGAIGPDPAYRVILGVGTNFDNFFMVGDVIRVRPVAAGAVAEERIVTQVISATQLMTDKAFSGGVIAGTPYDRVGRTTLEGFRYLHAAKTTPVGVFSGETLIDRAADLGAVLAMGAVSHLLTDVERQAVGGADENTRPAVNRVYQVFRNWNLNHRRINEWRMLVLGEAVSEKRGVPRDPDSLQPGAPAGWTSLTAAGEETANLVGWVPLVSKWLDVARRPGVNSLANEAFREGDPTNRKLSEGIAFLFDLPMPA
jgi:hypothetical protein